MMRFLRPRLAGLKQFGTTVQTTTTTTSICATDRPQLTSAKSGQIRTTGKPLPAKHADGCRGVVPTTATTAAGEPKCQSYQSHQ